MKRGSDIKLFFTASFLFVILMGFSYGYYLPYGRAKDAYMMHQPSYGGVAFEPIFASEAMKWTYGFGVMALLALSFALYDLRKQHRSGRKPS
jgi:hypothetical protein